MSSVSHPCIAVVDRIVVVSPLFSSISLLWPGPGVLSLHLGVLLHRMIKHLDNSHCKALFAMGHEVRYTSFVYICRFGNGMTA